MGRRTLEEYRRPDSDANLEDDWIEEADRDPGDTEWFYTVAQGLIAEGEEQRAGSLLEILDGELRERRLWDLRLDELRRLGATFLKPSRLFKEVMTTLEGQWSDKPTFAATVEWVGLSKVVEDPAKLWDRVTRLTSLLVFDVGEVVAMKGHGVGKVVEVNLALETLKIDFEKRTGVSLGFRAAAKMLKPLPPGHLLRRKIEDPESLARLRDDEPTELLRAVLETADKPMSAGEIRETLAGVVSDSQWTSWWAAARRHPQVVVVGSGRQSYRWENSAADALEAVRRSFDRSDPRRQLELLRRNNDRDDELATAFAGDLASRASECAENEPGLAWEIYFGLERLGRLPEALSGLVETLLGPQSDLRALLAGIQDRLLRERALTMIRDRREDWQAVYRDQLFREEDPRVIGLIVDGISSQDAEAAARLLNDIVAQPRRAVSAFVWLAERAADDEQLRARTPLRLLQQILAAMSSEDFSGLRPRLRALLESGGTVPRLFAHLDEEQAQSALDAIEKATALEPFQRNPLANALRMRFSSIGETQTGGPLYSTAESIEAKRAELKRIAEVEIPANRKAIEEARALGDLRENFEYKAARQRHEYLNARLASLHRDLGRARPIDFERLDTSEVRIGTRVRMTGPAGDERAFAILGPWDSRPESGVISYESELGDQLLGSKIGDVVRVGEATCKVVAIEPAIGAAQRPSPK